MGLFQNLFKKAQLRDGLPYSTTLREFFKLDFLRHPYDSKKNQIKHGYNEAVDLYSIIHKIVTVSSSVPFITQIKKGKDWETSTSNTIIDLLNKPNSLKQYSWNDIHEMLLIYLVLTGDTYLFGNNAFGDKKIVSVDVLPSQYVCIRNVNNDFFIPNILYDFTYSGKLYSYSPEQLAHIKMFNPLMCYDQYQGLSIVGVAKDVLQSMADKWEASAYLFQNRGMSGMITDKSNRPMTAEETKAVQEKFARDTAGTKKFGGIKVTNKDLNYIQMSMSSEDLQLVEQSVIGLRALCNVLSIDSSLFNDPENKTYANRAEAEKAMYTSCIIPLSVKLCQALTAFICPNHYNDAEYRIVQDFSGVEVLQANKKLEAEKDKVVMDGIAVVLGMPIGIEAKIQLIRDNFDVTEEFLNKLKIQDETGNQPK